MERGTGTLGKAATIQLTFSVIFEGEILLP